MKRYVFLTGYVFLVLLLIPTAVNGRSLKNSENPAKTATETTNAETETAPEVISVFFADEEKTEVLSMRDYIISAVAAEMPAAYEEQALRAQAAACVTLARYMTRQNAGSDENDGAVISTDSKKHQGYMSKEEMELRWGEDFRKYYDKLASAVDEVLPYCVIYNGEPAMTAFHAISSGKTESAANVWGKDIPYLTAVESVGDSLSAGYLSEVTVDRDTLIKAFPGMASADTDSLSIGDAVYTESGTLKSVTVNGVSVTGENLRSAFSLRSACITVNKSEDGGLLLQVKGYGHGVGLSQYGADYYARQGYSWQEIIAHYYPGTEIGLYDGCSESAAG